MAEPRDASRSGPSAAFDAITESELRSRSSNKWRHYPEDVLPLWVADMDFPVAEPIKRALTERIAADDLGYPCRPGVGDLLPSVAERLAARHGLGVVPEQVHPLSGIIPGLWLGAFVTAGPGEEVVIQPPVYPPFATSITQAGRRVLENPMLETPQGYSLDLGGLRAAITPATRAIILCNPQNPTGRVFTQSELEALAELVLEHRLWVISDEVHADLVLEGRHVPFASLSPEIAQRTITLYGPTKAFNIAGLAIGFAVSHNAALLERLRTAMGYMAHQPNMLAQHAAVAAYRRSEGWLDETLRYLCANRDHLVARLAREAPMLRMTPPQGTYLAWLDLRALGHGPDTHAALVAAGLGLNDGVTYGTGGEGFARLNFATTRPILDRAVDRLVALAARPPATAA